MTAEEAKKYLKKKSKKHDVINTKMDPRRKSEIYENL